MKMWPKRVFVIWLAVIVMSGCGSEINFDEPPDIRYGEDVCDRCNMIISEARFAAAYVTLRGQVRRFDDIGGMMDYYHDKKEEIAVFWVHDYTTSEWLKADDAFFVMNNELITPMGFGIVAVADKSQAETLALQEGGIVMSFEALLAQTVTSD